VKLWRLLSFAFFVLLAGIPAFAATVVYDFRTPAADAALSGSSLATYSSKGIPIAIEAGLLDQDGRFVRGASDSALAVVLDPPSWTLGKGLGVLSEFPSGSGPEEGLSQYEGLVFHFSPLFKPTILRLSGFTLGGPDGGGTFEAVRVFADGKWLFDLPGSPNGELAIPLPAGLSTLALTPLLFETEQIPVLSSDPVFYVASIEGAGARRVAFDLRPGSCPNPINTASRGVLPAAILGAADLNVAAIDPSSIRLAGVAPIRSGVEDVGTPAAGSCGSAKRDGRPDLALKFDTEAIVKALRASLGTLKDRQQVVLPLEGRFRDGTPFQAEDVALILVPKKGK
jgi:hypothetical protein